MEGHGDFLPPTIEKLLHTSEITVEANSYKTRGKPYSLDVNGETRDWHSVKGGFHPEPGKTPDLKGLSYEILFESQTKQWLKIVPPEAVTAQAYERLEHRLKASADMARLALQVADLPNLAEQTKDAHVKIKGQEVYGFVSPHIGPSVEYIVYKLTGQKRSTEIPEDAKGFLTDVYAEAYTQAERLYREYGIWVDDPNPGNILLHNNSADNSFQVALIDFSNKHQFKDNKFDRIPDHVFSPDVREQKKNEFINNNVKSLQQKFKGQCNQLGIPFIKD